MNKPIQKIQRLFNAWREDSPLFQEVLKTVPSICASNQFAHSYKEHGRNTDPVSAIQSNPLWDYFQKHKEGHGIWKWEHYFDIYHSHFARFIGRKVNILEIGIYSGGSLQMWRSYFGEGSHIYGVDIEEACKSYESDHVSVIIGDQADRAFWKSFNATNKEIDIIIDDGGHTPEQQQITLEETLSHLRPGGVYLCEDIHGSFNKFTGFAAGLVHELNASTKLSGSLLASSVNPFQSAIHSIHFYPYIVVIEKHLVPRITLSAPKHGTEWQPFL